MDFSCLFVKLLVIFILILIFYKLYKQSEYQQNLKNNTILAEGFQNNATNTTTNATTNATNNATNTNINYLKLNETHLEADATKLDLLYTNYSGEELGKDIWENKTLDQCTDLCNQLDKCIGFSRELINDDAMSMMYEMKVEKQGVLQ